MRLEELARRIRGFDPVAVSRLLEDKIQKGSKRKYFRFRYSRFYGGSAVGDVVGCNLRCAFCWTGKPRDDTRLGFWVTPGEASKRLLRLARRGGLVRLSAGEPTLGWRHLAALLDRLYEDGLEEGRFVLETNGILIGAFEERARFLAEHPLRPYVRVSVKACNATWFRVLTAASERGFELQLRAIESLYSSGAVVRVALFAAFGEKECWSELLAEIARRASPRLVEDVEIEPLVLYPTSLRRLRALGLSPTNPELVYSP